MAPLPPRPQSPARETRGNFSFGRDGFRALGDIECAFPARLKKQLSTTGGLRAPAVTRKWIQGQLACYDIHYDTNLTDDELADVIENSVRDGSCDQIPSSIDQIKKELRAGYIEKSGAAFRQLRSWCNANPIEADYHFQHLMSPTMEANFDIERFLERHFPDTQKDVRATNQKTHWAIALPCYRAQETFVRHHAEHRHLKFAVSGFPPSATYIISWSVNPMIRIRNKYNDYEYSRVFRKREDNIKLLYAQHIAHIETQALSTGSGPTYDLLRSIGHWAVRCDRLVTTYDISTPMTLDIHTMRHNPPPFITGSKHEQLALLPLQHRSLEQCGILAAFDFGIVRGTMAISIDPFVLPAFRRTQESFDEHPCFFKRLYFEWTGYSQRGQLQRSENHTNTGFLDFDEDCTIFKGVLRTEKFGEELVILGYKLSDQAGAIPRSFADYDEDENLGSDEMQISEKSSGSEGQDDAVDQEMEEDVVGEDDDNVSLDLDLDVVDG